jgi:hypothetical protein
VPESPEYLTVKDTITAPHFRRSDLTIVSRATQPERNH